MTATPRTWLISGCSTGLGRALAETLIAKGERVFATARQPHTLADLVEGHDNAHALKLDVTSPSDIRAAMAEIELAGGVDVLVNNAGYGYLTAIEEGDEEGYRAQFEANVFGLFALTKAILPGMRARGSGHVVNIASVGGLVGNPGSGYYAATKFGVVGYSEALSKEVGALGIKVTVVEPGPFRTTGPAGPCNRRPSGSPPTPRPSMPGWTRSAPIAASSPAIPCARPKRSSPPSMLNNRR